jgi:hypothetical protein
MMVGGLPPIMRVFATVRAASPPPPGDRTVDPAPARFGKAIGDHLERPRLAARGPPMQHLGGRLGGSGREECPGKGENGGGN